MDAGLTGSVALWAAAALALLTVVTGRRRLLAAAALGGVVATATLAFALLISDFSLAYVAETTSLATPWPYRLAALWGGMDGSMLFYSTLLLGVAAFALKRKAEVRAGAAIGLGLLVLTALSANPFFVPDLPAVDGRGLLAILQHPAMIYHPPILYSGLVILVVPFSIIVTGTGDRGARMRLVRRWLFGSWILLTFGMAFGANWAYVELGWGGYWAWDPVENTSLMPWLATTVFIHTSMIERATGRLRRWNVLFAGLPFALSVMGVYLTRSGVTGSIHSFAEDPVVGRVLLGASVVVVLIVAAVAIRSEPGEPWRRLRADRTGWLAVNAVLLTAALVFVTAGSAYPAFVSVFSDRTVVVDARYFVLTVLPVAIAIAVSLGFSLRASWMGFLVTFAVVAALTLVVAGPRAGVLLAAPAAGSLVALGQLFVTRKPKGRLLGAHLAHFGMALFLVAVAGSAFGGEFTGSMMVGDTVEVSGHEISLLDISTGETDRYQFVRTTFSVDGEPLTPEIRAYEQQSLPVAEPALRSTPVDDVIVATSLLFPDINTVAVSVFVRPLVWWVWVGAGLIGLGGLVSLVSRDGAFAARRRLATTERRREETTSESSVR